MHKTSVRNVCLAKVGGVFSSKMRIEQQAAQEIATCRCKHTATAACKACNIHVYRAVG